MEKKFFKVAIGNKIIDDFSETLEVYSPIDNKIIGSIPRVSKKEQIFSIFFNAKKAFHKYKNTSFNSRKKKLISFANLLKTHMNEISELVMLEIAKDKEEAKNEVRRSIDYIKQTIKEYEKLMKEEIIYDEKKLNTKGKTASYTYEPVGVVLAISPFNYPVNLLISKIAPSLISGNTVVFKPATQGSCVGSLISLLLFKAGFNNGEVSCIVGRGNEIGDFLVESQNIDMISFTGSTAVGKSIVEKKPLIPIVLELGGKDAAIVLEDANLEKASKEIIAGAFGFNGQRCTAIKRVLVDQKVEKDFLALLDRDIKSLKIGSVLKKNRNITELINLNAVKYNLNLLLDAYKTGAKTNQKIKVEGNIFWPIILQNVSINSRIAWEEQFGPILPVISFKTIEDAIEICNASDYGLQTSIFTSDIKKAKDIAKKLEVGTINVNKSSSRGPDILPFIAIKNSGKGMQGIRESIISMNRLKGVVNNT